MLSPKRLLVLSAAFLLIAPELRAQGWIEPIRPFPRGAIQKVRSAVQVAVTGRFARVTVEEWFRNTGPVMDEASYLYPLPGETVFSEFSLWQGEIGRASCRERGGGWGGARGVKTRERRR